MSVPSFDTNNVLARLSAQGKRILFYPSCGDNPQSLFELDYDVFVLADYSARDSMTAQRDFWHSFEDSTKNSTVLISLTASNLSVNVFRIESRKEDWEHGDGKWGFLFFEDNRKVLERIQSAGGKIHCFMGINDGCSEGGNKECVNDRSFLNRVFSVVASEGMDYFTDHTRILRCSMPNPISSSNPLPSHYPEFTLGNAYLQFVQGSPSKFPLKIHDNRVVIHYKVWPYLPKVREWNHGRLRITFEHSNIGNHLKELNGAVISKGCERLCKNILSDTPFETLSALPVPVELVPWYYFRPSQHPKWDSGKSMLHLLQVSSKRGWRVVGTTAFGERDYPPMLEVLKSWDDDLPQHIRVFHMDRGDFVDVDVL